MGALHFSPVLVLALGLHSVAIISACVVAARARAECLSFRWVIAPQIHGFFDHVLCFAMVPIPRTCHLSLNQVTRLYCSADSWVLESGSASPFGSLLRSVTNTRTRSGWCGARPFPVERNDLVELCCFVIFFRLVCGFCGGGPVPNSVRPNSCILKSASN